MPRDAFSGLLNRGDVIECKAASVYHQASNFWGVNYDITDPNEEDSDDSDSPEPMDWSLVRFTRPIAGHRPIGSSYVDVIGQYEDLYATRQNQNWPTLLFPDPYQADIRHQNLRNRVPPYGSLNGNLCVLIALLAFSASPLGTSVHQTLMSCIHPTGWRDPIGTRAHGWLPKRGIVVTLYVFSTWRHLVEPYERDNTFFL